MFSLSRDTFYDEWFELPLAVSIVPCADNCVVSLSLELTRHISLY